MSHTVLVLNTGSSSLKFAIIDLEERLNILTGLAECIGSEDAVIQWDYQGQTTKKRLPENSEHLNAIEELVTLIQALNLVDSLNAVGHRVVHGGEKFTQSSLITDDVIKEIQANNALAPLHNPANLQGIIAAQKHFSHLPQIAVFDTAFHQSLPQHAYLYALPYKLYQQNKIRRYGFHGTSHAYVAQQAAKFLNIKITDSYFITAHLGNGCSICAVKQGKSVDTSMGFTPLAGIMMGTRSGDIDPGLFSYLVNELNYSIEDINALLNKESGLLGLSQLSNDCRQLEQAKNNGNKQAKLALDVFVYHIAKVIASYTVALGRLSAIVFTGGIGENSSYIRERILHHLSFFALSIDQTQNEKVKGGLSGCISLPNQAHIKALVIPTNEELVIAQDAYHIVTKIEGNQ